MIELSWSWMRARTRAQMHTMTPSREYPHGPTYVKRATAASAKIARLTIASLPLKSHETTQSRANFRIRGRALPRRFAIHFLRATRRSPHRLRKATAVIVCAMMHSPRSLTLLYLVLRCICILLPFNGAYLPACCCFTVQRGGRDTSLHPEHRDDDDN